MVWRFVLFRPSSSASERFLRGGGGAVAADLPERDTTHHDRLDDLNFSTGDGGTDLGNGESVHNFNGNLQIMHATSPTYPVDGGGRFGLVRTYNSNAVLHDSVFNNGLTVRGVSWAGLGWKIHMGRFFSLPEYKTSTSPKYKKKRYFFETPSGALIDVVWEPTRSRYKYQTRPAPEICTECFPDCGMTLPPICDDGSSPPCEDNGPAPSAGCPERAPEDREEHYRVTFPGGTGFKLERRVGYQYTGNGYLKNADRAGFYTTRITDPAGNAIYDSYDNANPRFPEAITRVWSSARPGVGDLDIQLQTCITNDPSPQCPVGAEGAHKRIVATGFKGDRGAPQTTVFDYSYQVIAIDEEVNGTGTPKRVDIPFLLSVAVNGYAPGGSTITAPGGTTTYRYTTETHPGAHTARLLDRIGYPTQSLSFLTYGEWTSGQRAGSSTAKFARAKTGVIARTLLPQGDVPIDPDGPSSPLTAMAVRAQWVWERDFERTDPAVACASPLDTTGPDIDARVLHLVGPTGLVLEESWGGNPRGAHYDGWEAIGSVLASALRPSRTASPIRSEASTHHSIPSAVDGEPLRTMRQPSITTLHDVIGGCFAGSDSPGTPRKIVAENGCRTDNRWLLSSTRNDIAAPWFLPVRDGQPVQYRTERTSGTGTCFANQDMPYPLEKLKQLEDTGSADGWREESYSWICTEDPLNPDYAKFGLPSGSSSPWDWNPTADAPSVVATSTCDGHRLQVQSKLAGSLGYESRCTPTVVRR